MNDAAEVQTREIFRAKTRVYTCALNGQEPSYFSLKVGADNGAPGGAWSPDLSLALQFTREIDAILFKRYYLSREPGVIVLGVDI